MDLKRITDLRMHLLVFIQTFNENFSESKMIVRVLQVGGNGDRKRTRFRVGNLLREIFQRMNSSQSTGSRKDNFLKMVFYSGVRTTFYDILKTY